MQDIQVLPKAFSSHWNKINKIVFRKWASQKEVRVLQSVPSDMLLIKTPSGDFKLLFNKAVEKQIVANNKIITLPWAWFKSRSY